MAAVSANLDRRLLTPLMLMLVAAYRRWASPRKGFACPHRLLHGGRSCSAFGRDALRRRGVLTSRELMRRRFARCRAARAELLAKAEFKPFRKRERKRDRRTWRKRDLCGDCGSELYCLPDFCDCDPTP